MKRKVRLCHVEGHCKTIAHFQTLPYGSLQQTCILIILFTLAFCGWMEGGWEDQSTVRFDQSVAIAQGQSADVYAGIPPDMHLLLLDKQALEQAYLARLIRLFDVWLSSAQGQDTTNFQNGLRIARRGYARAADALAKRKKEIERQMPPAPQEQK